MKLLMLLLLATFTISEALSQYNFEPGYFVDTNNVRTECLINNADWQFTPTEFEYKTFAEGDVIIAGIAEVKEFGIGNMKFITSKVDIDRSADNISNLTYDRNPVFNQEHLFLKVLLEGKANLYQYQAKGITRFFFNIDNNEIQQLVFKRYHQDNQVFQNNQFRQQLFMDVFCAGMQQKQVERVEYKKNELIRYFVNYNSCENATVTRFEVPKKKGLVLGIRTGISRNNLAMQSTISTADSYSFRSRNNLLMGFEVEYFMPHLGNKWSVILEPNIYGYSDEVIAESDMVVGGILQTTISYGGLELPLGVRYYFLQRGRSGFFSNAMVAYHRSFFTDIRLRRADGSMIITAFDRYSDNPFLNNMNVAIGVGYHFNNRLTFEMRYYTPRELVRFLSYKSEYNRMSVILGINLF